jgi:TIR domain
LPRPTTTDLEATVAEVFINYRTGDGEWPAAFLDDKFKRRYGADRVFRDATSLEAGRDFRPELRRRLERCTVLVVVIGPTWLTARDDAGRRRLDNPSDYVRMEIEESLARKIRVVPLTLNDVRLPLADELPAKIAGLADRQSRVFRSRHYESDFEQLVTVIDKEIPRATENHDAVRSPVVSQVGDRRVGDVRGSALAMGDGPATVNKKRR